MKFTRIFLIALTLAVGFGCLAALAQGRKPTAQPRQKARSTVRPTPTPTPTPKPTPTPIPTPKPAPELFFGYAHSADVRSVAFSPDGRMIASGNSDNTIKLWEPRTGNLLRTMQGHSADLRSVAFSPDGRMIASGGAEDSKIELWESATGKLLRTLWGNSFGMESVTFSPDGRMIASGGNDNRIKLLESETGSELWKLDGHSDDVNAVAFSPDGRMIASGSDDDTIKLWETNTGKLLWTLQGHSNDVYSVAFSLDGRMIASGSRDDTIKLWEADTGKLLRTLQGNSNDVYSVAFSPDGRMIASGSGDNTIKLWEAGTGNLLRTLQGHSANVSSVAFSHDGRMIASGSSDKTIKLWEADTAKLLRTLQGYSHDVTSVAVSPDGQMLALGGGGNTSSRVSGKDVLSGGDNTIKLWDLGTGKLLRTLQGHSNDVKSVAFSPDGRIIVSWSADGTIKLWEAGTGKLLNTVWQSPAYTYISSMAVSPVGWMIAVGSSDQISLLEPRTGKSSQTLTLPLRSNNSGMRDAVASVAFSPDGRMIISGSVGNTPSRLWEIDTGKLLWTLSSQNSSVGGLVAFSPDGRMIAESGGTTIKLLESGTGNLLRTLQNSGYVKSVAFSPDGRMIASGNSDKTIESWEAGTGKLLQTLQGHSLSVNSVAFSPDGRMIVSGSNDGKVKLWSAGKGELLLTITPTTDADGLAETPDGYYVCSPSIERYVKWRVGEQVYENEKYKAQFNRPDIIAARLRGLPDPVLAVNAPPSGTVSQPPSRNRETEVAAKPPNNQSTKPKDTTLPKIIITSPPLTRGQGVKSAADRILKHSSSSLTVTGQATDESGVREVTVRGVAARLDERGNFSAEVSLQIGDNPITVTATDNYGNRATASFTVRRESEPLPVTGRYFALVIGNNRYPNLPPTQQLKTAINDAQEVAKSLRADYGFETKLLTDAKRVEIIKALNDYSRSLKPDDNLLIYYAGHGHFDDGTGKAYWIPTDAEMNYNANWIIADDVTANVRAIPARHILIVSDSCYSGTLTRATDFRLSTPSERERYLEKMRGGTSRILMASGGNEPVADGGGGNHSIFARALLNGLRGMDERVFTAEELFYRYIKEQVAGKSTQAPEYRYIQASGHDAGDFVFVRVK